MEENILRELVKSRKILKKKFDSIKNGETETFNKLENTFRPLTEPLRKLVKLSNENSLKSALFTEEGPKYEHKYKKSKKEENIITSTPNKNIESQDNFNSPHQTNELNEDADYKIEREDETFYSQSSDISFNLTKLNENKKLDTVFGPQKNLNGDWRFGNSDLKLSDEKIIIGNKSWALTPGLYSLIFHKKPKEFDTSEMEIYKKILIDTNAHRRNFNPNNQLKGNKGYKYTHIIKKLFDTTHIGSGLMNVNLHKPNYIYWDDPNELVDRLKLLIASQHAGNNNHTNEINSIIEELREANIIE